MNSLNNNLTVKSLLKDLPPISSLPEVIAQLEKEFSNPYSSIEDVGLLLQNDPNLTSKLLQIANSAFYGFPARVESPSQAITMVGIDQLKVILLGISVIDYFQNIEIPNMDMRSFWEHSIGAGLIAKCISVQRRNPNPEPFFVMGLLHAIGRLVYFIQIPDAFSELLEKANQEGTNLTHLEKETFGFDYAEVTAELLKSWNFPDRLSESIRYQHMPSMTAKYVNEASTINMANVVVNAMEVGNVGDIAYIPPIHPKSEETIILEGKQIFALTEEVDRKLKEVIELFI